MTQFMNQTIHVRFNGRSEEVSLADLHLANSANDNQIKQALSNHYDLPASTLKNHVIVRTSQAIVVRPEAIYG